jgi:hypothetical protein
MLRVCSLAALIMTFCVAVAAAQDMRNPKIVSMPVDWSEALAQLDNGTEPSPRSIARLNQAADTLFANIAASTVPVLLPFNSAQLIRDAAVGPPHPAATYLNDVRPPPFFQAGPGGYDAVFSVYAKELPGSDVLYSDRIDVHISGSALLYELDEPTGIVHWPVNGGLSADFPGIKRLYLESGARYIFTRYGVPYVVSIECHDGGMRFHKMSCREADKVAIRILRSLQVAGGTPHRQTDPAQPSPVQAGPVMADTIDRPHTQSPVFTYHSPGDILPGSGMRGHPGRADYTVYSKIRFPLPETPAFANSQSFNHWGDCDQTGRVSLGALGKTALYRCRVNGQLLIADESVNYAYPWRDNFCEHRYFFVGDCPSGLGHQGQDIRPSSCTQRIEGANRCEPYQHDVVAARDGMVLRAPGEIALYTVTNTTNERVRFRYLHMFPKFLDQDGMVSGRVVHEGEVVGKVGNFFRRERATTYHLHFDIQVPTKYGWVFVNPYMSLVAAYERTIQGRGRELLLDGTPIVTGANLPGPGLPGSGLPNLALPSSSLPSLALPSLALPSLALPSLALPSSALPSSALPRSSQPSSSRSGSPLSSPGAAFNVMPAIPAPAANPIEIEIELGTLNRFTSDTAGYARQRSNN